MDSPQPVICARDRSLGSLSAHVGSPDVYFEGQAGPYRLLVAIRTPPVVPGVAEVEVRALDDTPREVRVVPLRLTGPGAVFAPVPDIASRSQDDQRFFTAKLWMMVTGAWQVRVTVEGERGRGDVAIPVDALATRTLRLGAGLKLVLIPLGLFLAFGFVAIVGASAGQAQIDPGRELPPARRRRAWIARAIAAMLVTVAVLLSNQWWDAEANAYSRYLYKPIQMKPSLGQDGRLILRLHDPGWLASRVLDDIVPDHGHPMHLFLVRTPALDRVLHLHPRQVDAGLFEHDLPVVDAGRYRLFADIVHETGLPETVLSEMELQARAGKLTGDDSAGEASTGFEPDRVASSLPDGGRIVWERPLRTDRRETGDALSLQGRGRRRPARTRSRALHGHAGSRGVREAGFQRFRACSSVRDGSDGIDSARRGDTAFRRRIEGRPARRTRDRRGAAARRDVSLRIPAAGRLSDFRSDQEGWQRADRNVRCAGDSVSVDQWTGTVWPLPSMKDTPALNISDAALAS